MIPVFKVVEKQPAGTPSAVLFQNLICFLMNVGTEFLRQLVYSTVKKEDLVKLFTSEKIAAEVSQLMASNRLTQEQCHMLKDNPDPESFEISLLMILLTNENIFKLPDETVISDLKCLREIRGGIIRHSKSYLSKTLFEGYLQQMSGIFKRITRHLNVEIQQGMKLKLTNEKYLTQQNMQVPDSNLLLSFINWHLQDTDNYQSSIEILQLKLLPNGWATGDSPDGRLFYVNLDTRTASWDLNTVQDSTGNVGENLSKTADPLSKELNKLDQNQKRRQQPSQEDQSAGELQDMPGNSWMPESFSTLPFSGPQSSWGFSGQPYMKKHDSTLSQSMLAALNEQMKSVGVLLYDSYLKGTVFRVGTKYVMAAFHVIKCIIDPFDTGVYDSSRLEDARTCIHFNESMVISAVNPLALFYHVKRNFIFDVGLDVAVLEIADPLDLPRSMFLSKDEFTGSDISLIGYGNPKNPDRKCLDPKCKVIEPDSQRMRSVLAKLPQNTMTFKRALYECGRNTETVDLGYYGFDNPSKLLFDCNMESGASGAPVLTNDQRSVQVVGLLTNGLPEFYFSLPESTQKTVSHYYIMGQGPKMKYVYDWLRRDHYEISNDLFG